MCTQLCFRFMYAAGAGKTSAPVVEYVSSPEVNGSLISGLLSFSDAFLESFSERGASRWSVEKGWLDKRRIACVNVGWNKPPCSEYACLCVGRT
jgi:hypothetical protein